MLHKESKQLLREYIDSGCGEAEYEAIDKYLDRCNGLELSSVCGSLEIIKDYQELLIEIKD